MQWMITCIHLMTFFAQSKAYFEVNGTNIGGALPDAFLMGNAMKLRELRTVVVACSSNLSRKLSAAHSRPLLTFTTGTLILQSSNFTGTLLPHLVGNLTELGTYAHYYCLAFFACSNDIVNELTLLLPEETLSLANNDLTGVIPSEMRMLKALGMMKLVIIQIIAWCTGIAVKSSVCLSFFCSRSRSCRCSQPLWQQLFWHIWLPIIYWRLLCILQTWWWGMPELGILEPLILNSSRSCIWSHHLSLKCASRSLECPSHVENWPSCPNVPLENHRH